MAEPLGLGIAVMVFEIRVVFGAVVPGEFEEALAVGLGGRVRVAGVAEEVEVEFVVGVFVRAEEAHAHGFLVEGQGFLGGLDADHGVVLGRGDAG